MLLLSSLAGIEEVFKARGDATLLCNMTCFSFNLLFHISLPLTAGVDFSTDGFPVQVTIPAGETGVQFSVTLMNELIVERDEQFQVSFTYSGGQPGVIVRPGFDKANITIRNDDG